MDYLRKNPVKIRNKDTLLEGEKMTQGGNLLACTQPFGCLPLIIITTRGQMTNCLLSNAPFRGPEGKMWAVNGT